MFKKKLLLFLSIILILLIIPSAFAADNDTDSLQADLNATPVSNDIYFDANATNDHGEGTSDSPYQQLRDGRILDNSLIYLKNGEYNFSQLNTHSNISFIGQDVEKTIINGHGGVLLVNNQLRLTNVTLCGLSIFNQGDLIASNVIFANSSAKTTGSYGNSFGGAIYCVDGSHNAYLTNCSFINNNAGFGGAIYLNGGILEVTDCAFINNTAKYYGGAIACDGKNSNSRLSVKKSKFINDNSQDDAGGAIYIKSASLTASDLNISSCSATFGAALTLLKTNADLDNIYALNNTARYEGGAIYQIYSKLTINDSFFISNNARNGAGMFVDNASVSLNNVSFINNSAKQLAGAFYSLLNNLQSSNVTYLNNTAFEHNDLLKIDNASAIIKNNNYTLFNNTVEDGEIPKFYQNPATSVKNQLNGGNCWAFASLGALESAILKASGEYIDLSAENMKNLAALYSYYGWNMETNNGGYDDMALGYLTSWLGPVLQSDDEYSALSTLSPLLDSFLHVQNILFLKKSNSNDLTSIKRAIMDYGAVYSGIFMMAHYDAISKKYVQYYRGSAPCDHAVVLVGWDDDFEISGAPGKGAWIAKNSWGDDWGGNGYFYVSYYDDSCPKIGDGKGAVAFILNDTIKYDKNYQYDISKTDYFFNTTKTVWYKNVFTSTDNEYLAAVSTYFEKVTDYTFSVYVNNALKATKSGRSLPGYFTFDLDDLIPMNKGDVFEVVFKITVDGDAGVPISEKISLNSRFYRENISYLSYDGVNWRDFYNINWTYPDHIYDSQVACIKAFAVLNEINSTVSIAIENRTKTTADIVVRVLNQWGYPVSGGMVVFDYGGEIFQLEVRDGVAKKTITLKSANLTASFTKLGFSNSNSTVEIKNPLINTTISLNITGIHNPINITAEVVDENNVSVTAGFVTFIVDEKIYTVNVLNGTAKLENIIVTPSKMNISSYYTDLFIYGSSNVTESVEISRINTKISMNITAGPENNPINITAYVLDEYNNTVNEGYVVFRSGSNEICVNVVNGTANCTYTFLESGGNVIAAEYKDDYFYNWSRCDDYLIVSKIKVNLTLSMIINECDVIFGLSIKDPLSGFTIILDVDGEIDSRTSQTGEGVVFELKDRDAGTYNYTISLDSDIYEAENLTGQFNITYLKTQLKSLISSLYSNGEYSVELKDQFGNVIVDRDVYLTVHGKTYKNRTDNQGIAVFRLPLNMGDYTATVNFIGDDEYVKSRISANINIKSTINFVSDKYATNSVYLATLYDSNGNILVNRDVNVIFNDVEYNLRTDGKGQISLPINLKSGSYSVIITNPSTGELRFQTIDVVNRITSNKAVTMYYGAGKTYKVRVCDDLGKYVAGLKVTFKIKGKSYTRTTDKNGYASFKISLKPGKYTITAQYKGFKVSNKINVKTTLITKNIKVKKGKTIKFTAKLLNKNGKVLKNKKVTFKFKGKTYKVKTNRKGIATLKITKKYKKGKYTITTSYGKLKVKNSIKIR